MVGTLAAAVNWLARIALSWAFAPALSFELAVVIAYAIGMTSGFLLYRAHVFPESGIAIGMQIRRFIVVNLVSAAEVWLVAVLLVHRLTDVLGHVALGEALAHGIAIGIGAATSYLGHRILTFRQVQQA